MISLCIAAVESDQTGVASIRKVGGRCADLLSSRRHNDGACWSMLESGKSALGGKNVNVDRSFYRRRGMIKVLSQAGFSLDQDVSLED
jgi:hypothetical protein